MYEYKGFTAIVKKENKKCKGRIIGLEIMFEANTESDAVETFHKIADGHEPEPD